MPPDPPSAQGAPKDSPRLVAAPSRLRGFALVAHRYVGLVMATFLLVAGLTGSVIAFYRELDERLNPELFLVEPPAAGASLLAPLELHERIRKQIPAGKDGGNWVPLHLEEGHTVNYWVDGQEWFFDPYSGKLLGSRTFGSPWEGKKSFLTFLYELHFTLALGDVGAVIFGVVALLWFVDCFVGAYLTFPLGAAAPRDPNGKSWLRRWLPAWLLKTNKLFSLVFTWHRASGLWVWGMFLVFAWSAVALNLNEQIYSPVMRAVFGKALDAHDALPHLDPPKKTPKLGYGDALELGRRFMRDEAEQRGFTVIGERWLGYEADHGTYSYTVESTLDMSERLADTTVYFDGDSGKELLLSTPTGQNTNTTITSWLIALHFGSIREGGVAYRAFVCAMGLVVSLLSVTGVWIWWRKRSARWQNDARRRERESRRSA